MAVERRHPAVWAGIAGTAAALAPTTAFAASEALPSQHDVIQFGLGIVVGAAAATAVNLAVTHPRSEESAEADDLAEFVVPQAQAAVQVAPQETQEKAATQVEAPRHGRHYRPQADGLAAEDWDRLAVHDEADDTAPLAHRRASKEPAAEAAQATQAMASKQATRSSRIAAAVPDPAASTAASSKPADDYEQIAQNYVRSETFAARMASRARGVRAVLSERLGADNFDDVPVIQRADGTVGDVGTGWWDAKLGDSVRRVGTLDDALACIGPWDQQPTVMDVAREVDRTAAIAATNPDVTAGKLRAAAIASALTSSAEDRAERAQRIARAVPEVDQGAFPEHREVEELDEDLWDQALKAMGERMEQEERGSQAYGGVVTSVEPVGGVAGQPAAVVASVATEVPTSDDEAVSGPDDTIDEPEGLEAPTQFIPFRTPAGHPEVVDTDSYVDYLIRDEFSRNRSQVAKRTAHDYLQVIEGGTLSQERTNRMRRTRARKVAGEEEYHPKHLRKPMPQAQEA